VKPHLLRTYGKMFSFLGCFSSLFILFDKLYGISALSIPSHDHLNSLNQANHSSLLLVNTRREGWEAHMDTYWDRLRQIGFINIVVVLNSDLQIEEIDCQTIKEMM
jgi:hypothetical protein